MRRQQRREHGLNPGQEAGVLSQGVTEELGGTEVEKGCSQSHASKRE